MDGGTRSNRLLSVQFFLGKEHIRVVEALLDRLPSIHYTAENETITQREMKYQLVLTHKYVLSAYIQLCNVVDFGGGGCCENGLRELYHRRLAMAKRALELSREFQVSRRAMPDTGWTSAVRYSKDLIASSVLYLSRTLIFGYLSF